MTPVELLSRLYDRNIKLWTEDGKLRYKGPKGALSADLLAAIAECKAELIALLRAAQSVVVDVVPPIQPISRAQALPLSFAQQRLWFLDQLQPGLTNYNLFSAVRLIGPLDVIALRRSFDELTRRHESLRTSFAAVNGSPIQVIAPAAPFPLARADLRALPPSQRAAATTQQVNTFAQQPFDLAHGPLLRARLLQTEEHEQVLLLAMHHIVSDGWSMGVLINDMAQLYTSYAAGQPSPLPELPIQYADFAYWQRAWLQGAVGASQPSPLQSQLAYWRSQLGGELPVLALPTDRPRPALQTFRGASQLARLPAQVSSALSELNQREEATLFMSLLAVFDVLLARYSGQPDVLIGTPIANRTRTELERLIGFFVNTLVLRADLSGNPSFRQLLGRVRAATLGAYANQDLPFEKLVEELQPTRDPSRSPLFQVLFALQNTPLTTLEVAELTWEPVASASVTAQFDLLLSVSEIENELIVVVNYNTDLFDAATIRRLLGHFQTLLTGIVADPNRRVDDLPLLSAVEQHQLLGEWTATVAAYPYNASIQTLFEAQVARTPDAVALVCAGRQHADEQLTYHELNARANQLAHELIARGVGPDTLVGLCVDRSLALLIGIVGILKAGGAYVPLDPAYPAERLAFMIEDAQLKLLITHQSIDDLRLTIDDLGETDRPIVNRKFKIVNLQTDWPAISMRSRANPPCRVVSEQRAYIIYTSGSTGQPKGVMVRQRGLLNLCYALRPFFDDPLVRATALITSVSFDISVNQIFPTLLFGRRLHVIADAVKFSSSALLRYVDEHAIELMDAVPSYLQLVLRELAPARLPNAFRYLLIGGEKIETQLLQAIFTQLGERLTVVNIYGLTEITDINAFGRISAAAQQQPVTIGRALANNRIYILNPRGQLQPIGVVGEVHVAGVQLARGYLNRPELTAARFVPNPFAALTPAAAAAPPLPRTGEGAGGEGGTRLCRTGDLGRWRADGQIELLGRIDQQIKLRGFRIEVGEIEARLEAHRSVRECAVAVVRADASGEQRLVAYVVPIEVPVETQYSASVRQIASVRRPSSLASELRTFLATQLPDYMLPTLFVLLDALPRTPSGKIDRKALPAPQSSQAAGADSYVAARTPIEELLVTVWTQVLGREGIGVYDNFFGLGGHSLLATQVIARIRESLQVELPLRSLFETPTIAGLAERVAQSRQDDPQLSAPPIIPVERVGALPLSFAQQRLWFLDQLAPGLPTYTIPTAVQLSGSLSLAALHASFAALIQRHQALRTTFVAQAGQPAQIIHPPAPLPLPLLDLQPLAAPLQHRLVQQLLAVAGRQSFDLATGPLLRLTLLRLAPADHILLLVVHHIVADAWSISVLIREIVTHYAAARAGQPSPLPPLPIQYADFAIWQRSWLAGARLDQQRAYWQQQLGGDLPTLELPTDRPRPPLQTVSGANLPIQVPAPLAAALGALCRQHGLTRFMALLTALLLLLQRLSGQDDIAVGTPIANRTHTALEGLIGFFVNTLVLRADLSGAPSVATLLERVRTVALDAYAHQELPFEQVVDLVQPARDASRSPLFQVLFALQNVPTSALTLPELDVRGLAFDSAVAKFDLTLALQESDDALGGVIEYNTDLFDATTIMRLRGQFVTLLGGMVAQPAQPISALPLLTASEQQQLRVEWTAGVALPQATRGLHELIAAQAARTPDTIALVFSLQPSAFSVFQLTYAALNDRANQLAWHLRERGVGPETRVGVCLERSLELVIGLLGVLKAGAAYVPLDPAYPAERLAFMIEDAQLSVLLTATADKETRRQGDKEITQLPVSVSPGPLVSQTMVDLVADWPLIARQPTRNLAGAVSPEQPAYMIYTSGSTGTPKGVLVTHRGIVNHMGWVQATFPLTAHDRMLQQTSFSFDAAVWELYAPLLAGAQLVLARPGGQQDSAYLVDTFQRAAITTVQLVPSLLRMLLEQPDFARCTALTRIFCGGEVLPVELAERCTNLLNVSLHNMYGPTEATIDAAYWRYQLGSAQRSVPIGRAVANTQLYVLDAQMRPVAIGVAGELYIGGAGLARGYHNRPDLTAERFVPNPFREVSGIGYRVLGAEPSDTRYPTPDTRLYKTGDRVRWLADGTLDYLGRSDQQIKLRGYRIELGEIAAVLGQHPSVRACAVLVREDIPGDTRLVAYVVPLEDERRWTNEIVSVQTHYIASVRRPSSLANDLRTFLSERLPSYMVPVAYVLLDALPLMPNGKVDRHALPAAQATGHAETLVVPRNELELQLVRIWEALLGVTPIGVTDNFFTLGGHSLLALRLMAQIQQQLGRELPLATLFAAPTIEQLATLLQRDTTPRARSALVALQPLGSRRPFFCVHPAGGEVLCYYSLARQLGADQPFYGLRAPGLDGEQPPYTTITALAAHYIAVLRELQPEAPYLLGGWSFGGGVAFEMAQQLHIQGQEIALLALFDSQAPSFADRPAEDDDLWLLYGFAQDLGLKLEYFTITLEQLQQLDADERLSLILEQARVANLVPMDIEISTMRQLFAVFKTNVHAMRSYVPQVYPGRITFFRAAERLTPDQPDLAEGWRALAAAGVAVQDIPGNHYTIVRSPQVQVLAAQLTACLDAAQQMIEELVSD